MPDKPIIVRDNSGKPVAELLGITNTSIEKLKEAVEREIAAKNESATVVAENPA